jgi:acetyltransferase-like isoleucine patch superfamily enzyme|tara:strand:- start:982 stop:1536 length:555 start_codon:yes stop_codon:yes gene_type:complete
MTVENIHLWNADKGTYFDRNINIISWSDKYKVNVGKHCSVGREVNFFLHANHRSDWVTTSSTLLGGVDKQIEDMHFRLGHPECKGDINIGNDVWVGSKATIMSGVTIGDGAVIGSGAVVAKDIPPYAIVVGNPSKIIKYRFTEEQIEKLLQIQWWGWSQDKIRYNALSMWSTNINEFINKHFNE